MTTFNVKDFNVIGDNVSDDRDNIQAVMDRSIYGDTVYMPNGQYKCGGTIHVPAGVTIEGESVDGVVWRQPYTTRGTRMLFIDQPDVKLRRFSMDGQYSLQPISVTDAEKSGAEHNAGVIVTAPHVTIEDVIANRFTGDGIYIYTGANYFVGTRLVCMYNQRNGATIGGAADNVSISYSKFVGNRVTQFDEEPAGDLGHLINNARFYRCVFDGFDGANVSQQPVLSISGSSATDRSNGQRIVECEINGSAIVIWCNDTRFEKCWGINGTIQPSIMFYRTNNGGRVDDCIFTTTQTTQANSAVIAAVGSAEGGPANIVISNSRLYALGHPHAFGVRADACVSVRVEDTKMYGPGIFSPGSAGLVARAGSPARNVKHIVVRRCHVENFGTYGVNIMGNGAALIELVHISDNTFIDTTDASIVQAAMPYAMVLNDDSNCVLTTEEHGNLLLGRCTTLIHGPQPGTLNAATGYGNRWTR